MRPLGGKRAQGVHRSPAPPLLPVSQPPGVSVGLALPPVGEGEVVGLHVGEVLGEEEAEGEWEGEGESAGEGEGKGVLPRRGEAVEFAQGVLVGVGRGVEEGEVVTV